MEMIGKTKLDTLCDLCILKLGKLRSLPLVVFMNFSYLIAPFLVYGCSELGQPIHASFPASNLVQEISFDLDSIISLAPGSDNWAVTWGKDGSQYVTWGDGGGFGGDNAKGRVSLGVGQISGPPDDMQVRNIWGGFNSHSPATFTGKSYGIISIDDDLWLWNTGSTSDSSAFREQRLFHSSDQGKSWVPAGVSFTLKDFGEGPVFYAPSFLQFGQGYQHNVDSFVYIYAPEAETEVWDVQIPGKISLIRVNKDKIADRSAYEFFKGFDDQGNPSWTHNLDLRKPVFEDINGVMRTSVTYNTGLKRYILITQQISRFKDKGYMGIYESKFPWGPWSTISFASPWNMGLQRGEKSVYWNFSNKWTSKDGKNFYMIYTGPGSDEFGLVKGHFILKKTETIMK